MLCFLDNLHNIGDSRLCSLLRYNKQNETKNHNVACLLQNRKTSRFSLSTKVNKCVTKNHIRQTRGCSYNYAQHPRPPPLLKDNSSVANCMPLAYSKLLQVALLSQRGRAMLRVCQ